MARKERAGPAAKAKGRVPNAAAPVWESLRHIYSADAQAAGDAAAMVITLRDLLALELAEHGALMAEQQAAAAQETVEIIHARVQSRKAMRVLAIALGEARKDPDAPRPRLPDAFTGDAWLRQIAALELQPPDEIVS